MQPIAFGTFIDQVTAAAGARRCDVRDLLVTAYPSEYGAWNEARRTKSGQVFPDPPAELVREAVGRFTGGAGASADISGVSPGVVALIKNVEASKANGGAGSQGLDYEPITDETKRLALGYSKKAWAERKQARGSSPATTAAGEANYFDLVREERQRTGCSFVEAAKKINRTNPEAWVKMLEAANPGRDFHGRIAR